ncbi:hypothetical protein B0H14DRAFT_2619983 [Mycena olivaceomarginata]|nr:hypothetical protein B0H14DRAFT_2619983 [Mycena olivaceomarginata]
MNRNCYYMIDIAVNMRGKEGTNTKAVLTCKSGGEAAEGVGIVPAAIPGAKNSTPDDRTSPVCIAGVVADMEALLEEEHAGLAVEGRLDLSSLKTAFRGATRVRKERERLISDHSPQGLSLNSLKARPLDVVDLNSPKGAFFLPRVMAGKALKALEPVVVGNRYFSTWFASDLDPAKSLEDETVQDDLLQDDAPVGATLNSVKGNTMEYPIIEYVSVMAVPVSIKNSN